MKNSDLVGLIALLLGTIFLVLAVNPVSGPLCTLTQDACYGIDNAYHHYVVDNFINYFIVGLSSMALSIIIFFLGRREEYSKKAGSTKSISPLERSAYVGG